MNIVSDLGGLALLHIQRLCVNSSHTTQMFNKITNSILTHIDIILTHKHVNEVYIYLQNCRKIYPYAVQNIGSCEYTYCYGDILCEEA